MKKILLAIMFLGVTLFAIGQEKIKGDLQVGTFGGASIPVGTYKSVGGAKTGYYSGLFVDKYFGGNKFGLGIDARYLYNGINTQDSFFFENGFVSTDYKNKQRFQDYLFTFGPTYKYTVNRFHAEAYLRGGVMLQYFPEYVESVTYTDVRDTYTTAVKYTVNDASNKANSWAGLTGLRFSYMLNRHFAVFGHVDYVQTFGTQFGGKASQFTINQWDKIDPIEETTVMNSVFDYYEGVLDENGEPGPRMLRTPHQTINAGVGVKYIFGKKARPVTPRMEEERSGNERPKDLQIVVKDKQTNLALSGVTVSIKGLDMDEKSISDANGQAARIKDVKSGKYEVIGEKNGIKTPLLILTEADFRTNASVILKEIYHDDPRFTLIGETFDCVSGSNLPNINTILTNTGSNANISQISDAEGKFIYQLDSQTDFTVVANQQGRYSQTELVSTKGLDRSQTLYVTLKMGVCELTQNGSWVLKNIHYDFDKHVIRPDAAIILDNVISVLKQNPTLKIELSSHTDSRGNDDYNQRLSQRRADAAVAYLVSKEIAKNRLVAQGYGESRLINSCGNGVECSEAQHQENRRTEIKVLEY